MAQQRVRKLLAWETIGDRALSLWDSCMVLEHDSEQVPDEVVDDFITVAQIELGLESDDGSELER